ncbi:MULTISPECIES: glutamate ABC transporter substrate-binding protein [Microbacterium]|jgi:glutamate transport system substrate-binding protein|uniref:glutamate ABC transporter substrate-binding protein n=1 Tax=Microbacterium TaxID=33882 RepID=UPI0006F5A0FA|nr:MULTISPECIES: glutamate ABC transporter substrate-binding protein [Microbacterium]KQP68930.1 ABC transporter substrate-binding protein [Microbacterium sp. Leaf288]MDR7112574.1 glutamate transport system substrate-binding protein [Microbacterium trichothecenolyticum]MDT0144225.1 glutamate ABC transporter substrate-binding protein [Microbacterium sp. PRC9]
MKRMRLPLIALAAAGALALSACASGGTPAGEETTAPEPAPTFEAGTTMAELAEAGTITIGTKFDQPLFGLNGPNGPEGFDVEIGKIIASELGIAEEDIEWKEAVSANREPFIQNGEVDIVVATYTINDKRKEVVSFAGPYYMAGQSILVLADNDDIKSEDDLVGQPVCSVTGSTPAAKLAEIGAEPVLTDTYSNCLEPLRSGAVVAVSTDNVILAGLAAQNEGEFKVVGEPFTEEPYGIGLALEDTDFRMWINDVLEKAYEDGRYEEAWNATAGTVLPFVEPPTPDRY